MKVKVLTRNPDNYLRETKKDIFKVERNYDSYLHPFEAPREYTRALNSAKLDRVFAKPFLGSLDGHTDGVACLAKHPKTLSHIYSGSMDGEIRGWNLSERKCAMKVQAHKGYVRGLCFTPDGQNFLSVGDDKTINRWKCFHADSEDSVPTQSILSKSILMSIAHHRTDPMFATCGEVCQIWEETRSEPLKSFQWGVDSQHCVRFNPVENHLLASCASDRSIILYDTRGASPLRRVILQLKSNSIAWNPMEAFIFTVANEDYNLYTFDMRNLSRPLNVHMDHVSAVIDLDFAPTGKEFVSGSYDKTIRIFPIEKGRSRDVYHTKRMQRLTCVSWSLDNKYILCGSDEMNIRLWKARASEKLGLLSGREKNALNYEARLKEKFGSHPQVKRILRHRHVPKHIYNGQQELQIIKQSRKRREANRRAHSKPGSVPHVPEKAKAVLSEQS
ncbi:unnamed protein product [Darwinula stevensoni]|uniref:DDB1- and CUL4-associated factor 13 n=1 Tax=Darwinula stevensoni TaxID=69355 RepID=A0A7R8XEE1_9CRUS|nr:unnamed protein product [Darwinula stevensoni]CAG0887728.1 unnamed protein product [Darwinula stevensoni]